MEPTPLSRAHCRQYTCDLPRFDVDARVGVQDQTWVILSQTIAASHTHSSAPSNTIVPSVTGNQYQGTFSKFQMIEDMGNGQAALCFVASTTGPLFVYKLPAGGL